jgi:hypothetical protein
MRGSEALPATGGVARVLQGSRFIPRAGTLAKAAFGMALVGVCSDTKLGFR